jgi:hypothetical protein
MRFMQRKAVAPVCATVFFVVVPLLCSLALMVEYDLNRLVKESSDVVTGKVVKKESHWTDDKRLIVTDVTIAVDSTIKGKVEKTIIVQHPGGAITNPDGTGQGMSRDDMPEFAVDEDVLLFLNKKTEEKVYKVTANSQGKFKIVKDKATGKQMVESPSKILADPKSLKLKEAKEYKVPLADIVARVKKIVEAEQKEKE